MTTYSSTLTDARESVTDAFLYNPANFSDERSLASAVRHQINAQASPASVATCTVTESSGARGSITDHDRYTQRYAEITSIDRAHCEIGGPQFPFGDTERLDLGIFGDDISLRINNGTQEFDPEDLEAAVEFKYIKNTNYLRYRPDDEQTLYHDITTDIARLGQLPAKVDRRMVVVCNYDVFRREDTLQAKTSLSDAATNVDVDLTFVLPDPV